jgi:general secretion pathway protein I
MSGRGRGSRSQRGFGLLEAIVSLTVLAGAGLALFAWINQNLQTASRLQEREVEARLQLQALALLEALNPAQQPTGELQRAGLLLSWRAELVEPVRANAGFSPPQTGLWVLGLYQVQLKVRDAATGRETNLALLKIGSRRLAAAPQGSGG